MRTFQDWREAVFGWSEPYPLFIFVLVLLIILPGIFKSERGFLKLSRIYNSTRLGLISILHQVVYCYTLVIALQLFIAQTTPCIHASSFGSFSTPFTFPQTTAMTVSFLGFSVIRFTSASQLFAFPIFAIVLGIIIFTEMCERITTAFQGIASIFLAYIIHFAHMRIPYRFIHVENIFLALFCLAAAIYIAQDPAWGSGGAFADLWFSWVTVAIDELILARHHMTRKGFTIITCPGDVIWAGEKGPTESLRLLASEEEHAMEANVWSDFLTSIFAFVAIVVGVVVRKFFDPAFFDAAS
jgi:hypothetical protein